MGRYCNGSCAESPSKLRYIHCASSKACLAVLLSCWCVRANRNSALLQAKVGPGSWKSA